MITTYTADDTKDSTTEVRAFFDKFYENQVTFPAAEIDAVNGYFLKRNFDEQAAKSITIVILNQARADGVSVFQLVDTLKGLTDVQLSQIIMEILNANREKTSALGYRLVNESETIESRNIRL